MTGKLVSLAISGIFCTPLSASSISPEELVSHLKEKECFEAEVSYQVLMSLQNDVDYTVRLSSVYNPQDSLLDCGFLIDWTMPFPDGEAKGFSAYFDGNVYNFRGDRMLEYHYPDDKNAFFPGGSAKGILRGVHQTIQFSQLLPQIMADEIKEIISDQQYEYYLTPDTIISGNKYILFEAKWLSDGEVMRQLSYRFDPKTFMPVYTETDNNPGAIAEQTIIASYTYPKEAPLCTGINEEKLIELYPSVFEKFRESNFAIENLPGQKLPGFALPTLTGERYLYHRGDRFRNPTVIAIIDPSSTFAKETVDAVRDGLDRLPYSVDVMWAFVSNNHDEIEEITGSSFPEETTLMSAKSLARDCGASMLPVLIFANPSGEVEDVTIGYNNNLVSDVIQKVSILANQNKN